LEKLRSVCAERSFFMSSRIYQFFAEAMAARRPVACIYQGHPRTVCPVILGHSDSVEKALTWQIAGQSSQGPVHGQWKCLTLSEVEKPAIVDGPWRTGKHHRRAQSCVKDVDLDVNPDSPYAPKRSL
jgi:hypothetical protein